MRRVLSRQLMDLSRYDPLDWTSRLRLRMALDTAGTDAELAAWQQVQTFNLGLATIAVAAGPTGTELKQKALEAVFQASQQISEFLIPWMHKKTESDIKQAQNSTYQRMFQAWMNEWGDPKDPAVAARIQKTADWLHKTSQPRRVQR